MTALTPTLARQWEAHHPLALALVACAGAVAFGPRFYLVAAEHAWKVDQIYTCVFTLATVFTAFLFTFYTFVITADRGFIAKVRHTAAFSQTVTYTISAIAVGSILCVATVPLLVVQPSPDYRDPWLIVVALWSALTVGATASFIRAAYLFSIFARNQA
jgi:hypothetical protein